MYRKLMIFYNEDENVAKSFALRLLLHYLGDQSQPLHNLNIVNSFYPTSDAGGNAVKLPSRNSATSLHAVWDKVVYKHHQSISRPFDAAGRSTWANFEPQY